MLSCILVCQAQCYRMMSSGHTILFKKTIIMAIGNFAVKSVAFLAPVYNKLFSKVLEKSISSVQLSFIEI